MAFVESIRKSFSRKRGRNVDQAASGEASAAAAAGVGSDGASASAKPRASGRDSITCVVTLLDESEASFEIEVSTFVHGSRMGRKVIWVAESEFACKCVLVAT